MTPPDFPRYTGPGSENPDDRPQDMPWRQESPYNRSTHAQPPYDPNRSYNPNRPLYDPNQPYDPNRGSYYPGGPYPPAYGPGQTSAYGAQPYGYGYTGTHMRSTNGLAVAALVVGVIGFVVFAFSGPVALGLGIAALVQIRRTGDDGKGLAVAGVVLGALQTVFLLVVGALFAVGVWAGFRDLGTIEDPTEPAFTTQPGEDTLWITDLRVGECFDDAGEDGEVYPMDCAEDHDAEVYAGVVLPPGKYPGDRAVEAAAEKSCDREYLVYVGTPVTKTSLEPSFWYPGREDWEGGDRSVTCVVYGPDGELLTGTVKGSKR